MSTRTQYEMTYCHSCFSMQRSAPDGACSHCGAFVPSTLSPPPHEDEEPPSRSNVVVTSLTITRSVLALMVFLLMGGLFLSGLARRNQAAQAASVARERLIYQKAHRKQDLLNVLAALEVLYHELRQEQGKKQSTAAERIVARDRWRRDLRLIREKYQLDSSYLNSRDYDDAEEALNAAMLSLSALQLHLERGDIADVAALRISFEQSLEDARSELD